MVYVIAVENSDVKVKFEELFLVRRPVQYEAFYVALLKYPVSPCLFLLLSFLSGLFLYL